jgi:hypothetical protein
MMFSHTTIRFSYGPRGPGFGKLASIIATRSAISSGERSGRLPLLV